MPSEVGPEAGALSTHSCFAYRVVGALAVFARSPGCMPGFAFVTCLTSRALHLTRDDSYALRPFCSHARLHERVDHTVLQLRKPWQVRAHGSTTAEAVPPKKARRQTVDYTLLAACVHEMQAWRPAKVEQVVQYDRSAVSLRLRTLEDSGFLHLSWDPSSARIHLGGPPSRGAPSEAYSFGTWFSPRRLQQILHDCGFGMCPHPAVRASAGQMQASSCRLHCAVQCSDQYDCR